MGSRPVTRQSKAFSLSLYDCTQFLRRISRMKSCYFKSCAVSKILNFSQNFQFFVSKMAFIGYALAFLSDCTDSAHSFGAALVQSQDIRKKHFGWNLMLILSNSPKCLSMSYMIAKGVINCKCCLCSRLTSCRPCHPCRLALQEVHLP